ncbi:MAG: hypothetical protein LBM02_09960 [Lachnospiraceae bacterium]|jgi:hypothetical protein|nr:hypothetical protein [Lachnospiraceae bacterium]
MSKDNKFIIKIDKEYTSEHELYYKMISIHNVVEGWGLTPTQINILVYLIRLGISKDTKDIICKNLKISEPSLNTNLSYLRQGKVGNKRIKKLLEISENNNNITLLKQELKDIKDIIEEGKKQIMIKFMDIVS